MDKLKFGLFSIVVLSVVGLAWYWSVATIESGSEHALNQRIKELTDENNTLREQVAKLVTELDTLKPEEVATTEEKPAPVAENTDEPLAETSEHASLIKELEKLVADNIYMKLKSTGSRVGTVQNFLNIYNDSSNRVDNDYGPGTVKLVTEFQKAEGLTADGEAGPTTFKKMIEWLKDQG